MQNKKKETSQRSQREQVKVYANVKANVQANAQSSHVQEKKTSSRVRNQVIAKLVNETIVKEKHTWRS